MRPGHSREGPGSAAARHSAADEDALVEPMTPAPSFRAWTIAFAPSLVFILPPAFQCFHCPETCMTSLRQTQDAAMPWPQGPPAPRGQNPNPDVAGEALHDQRLLSMTASCLGLSSRPHSFLSIPCLPGSPGQSDPRFFHMSLPLHMLCLLTPSLPSPLLGACLLTQSSLSCAITSPARPWHSTVGQFSQMPCDSVWHWFSVSFPIRLGWELLRAGLSLCHLPSPGPCTWQVPLRVCIDVSLWVHREGSVGVAGGARAPEGSP